MKGRGGGGNGQRVGMMQDGNLKVRNGCRISWVATFGCTWMGTVTHLQIQQNQQQSYVHGLLALCQLKYLILLYRQTPWMHCPSPLSAPAHASCWNASGNFLMLCSSGPLFLKNCTYAPSTRTRPSWRLAMYSSRRSGVKPQFLLTMIFWRPGNLYWLRRRASTAVARSVNVSVTIRVLVRCVCGELTRITSADGEDDLADVHAGDEAVGLAEGASHAGLQTIGSCARQHLVDADDVVRMGAHAEVEPFLACDFDEVPDSPDVRYRVDLSKVSFVIVLTCWRRCEPPPALLSSPAHTRWRPSGCSKGTRRRWHACGPNQRF